MYELITNRSDIRNELQEVLRCFSSGADIEETVNLTYVKSDDKITVYVTIGSVKYVYEYPVKYRNDQIEFNRYDLYLNKHSLYEATSAFCKRTLPWGSLTGIRPTRLALRLSENGDASTIVKRLETEYGVSHRKAELTAKIVEIQAANIGDRLSVASNGDSAPDNLVNLYVHVPFCPTRCSYCSFVSQGVEKQRWLLTPYVESLIREIRLTKEVIDKQGKKVFSVYLGGGTPTVLSAEQLYRVLEATSVPNTEFTCEAGRPDTIDEEKLDAMNRCGVNRVSINPQTLHDKTLEKIGRKHTCKQFFSAYESAKKFGFVKNVDLIAGLEGESVEDFVYSLDNVIALKPENVTVHTLCLKRGSQNAATEVERNAHTEEMVNYSVEALSGAGYIPYYLYRQKQMTANLENIGWCKPHFICVNNITVMEETLPVYACGAGAISKIMPTAGKIQRLANPKDVILYLDQFEERMKKKQLFYENQFTTP